MGGFGWAFKLKVFRERRVLLKQVSSFGAINCSVSVHTKEQSMQRARMILNNVRSRVILSDY